MKKRKFGLLISSVVATGAILGACGTDDGKKENTANEGSNGTTDKGTEAFSIAMVTDTGGVDDKSFNQSAWEGIQQFGKDNGLSKGDGGFDYLESKQDSEYNTNLNALIRRDFDLVFGVGFLFEDAMGKIASQQKDAQLAIIDGVVDAPNVASVLFNEQEGAFLAGVAAAKMSQTGKIGFIGGLKIPVIERFHAGFIAGAKAANPDIIIEQDYAESFDKADIGKMIANRMYSSGVDIIFHAAGGAGNGVFTEAKERKEKDANANVWVIGVDKDQYDEGKVGDQNVTLTSMVKGVGNAVIDIANRTKEGNFPGGKTTIYGLAEGGVGLADSRGAINDEVLAVVKEFEEKIIAGEIKVPTHPDDVK
ncbi:BMP family lipoprotein [Bacillus ndiopicus]|uniref:BMP family lipoprotein n=1 Tax=Bacillus ndiopicus TaxID=1347368 RepID=UPI0005AAAD58|nr:BMP family protein [Bacillus ndiopicus]